MTPNEPSHLDSVKSPADRAVVFVCEKCGKHAPCSGKELRQEIRSELKTRGQKGAVRVVLTGCLDICPKRGVAMAVARNGNAPEYLVAEGEAREVAEELLGRLN